MEPDDSSDSDPTSAVAPWRYDLSDAARNDALHRLRVVQYQQLLADASLLAGRDEPGQATDLFPAIRVLDPVYPQLFDLPYNSGLFAGTDTHAPFATVPELKVLLFLRVRDLNQSGATLAQLRAFARIALREYRSDHGLE